MSLTIAAVFSVVLRFAARAILSHLSPWKLPKIPGRAMMAAS